jgi:hypothetical protein
MMHNDTQADLNAPPRMVEALRRVSRKELFVPPAIDDAILNAARQHLQPKTQVWLHWPRFLLASAAVVIVIGFGFWIAQPHKIASDKIVGDVNGDGRVDILDAFALARCVKASPSACSSFDMNSDGVIDQRDVDLLAARAVRLEKRSRS